MLLLVTKYFLAAWTSRFPMRNTLKQRLLESKILLLILLASPTHKKKYINKDINDAN